MLKALCLWLNLCSTISGPAYSLDGDTLVVNSYHIRLHGIDAEELHEPNGQVSREALARIISGHSITCHLTGSVSYNRKVGSCFIGQVDIAELMVRYGFALDCARYSRGKYRSFEPAGIRLRLLAKPYC